MQGPEHLLASLEQRGVVISVELGKLRVRALKGCLLREDIVAIQEAKTEILNILDNRAHADSVSLQRRNADCQIPLTAFQHLFWEGIRRGSPPLSTRACVTADQVFGPLRYDLLRHSVATVAQRHEALRTRIVADAGPPRQHIDATWNSELEIVDTKSVHSDNVDSYADIAATEFVQERINVATDPLFKARLVKMSDRQHLLVLASHHLISDGVSKAIVSREIWSQYHRELSGRQVALPELRVQFPDYAVWQQQTRDTWLSKHNLYWKERFLGAPHTRLPIDNPRGGSEYTSSEVWEFPFGLELSVKLQKLARRERSLLGLVVLTLYISVMSRWCEQRDLIVGVMEHGRYRAELQDMVGFLAQLLLLRIEVTSNETLHTLLEKVNAEFYAACDHRDFTRVSFLQEFTESITDLHFVWLPDSSPLETVPDGTRDDEVRIQSSPSPLYPIRAAIAPGTFLPYFFDTPAGIIGAVVYRPDLVALATLELFGRQIKMIAESFVESPSNRVGSAIDG